MKMNQSLSVAATLVLSAIVLALVAVPANAEVNRIVLRVNDRIATLYDYEKLKRDRIRTLMRSNVPEDERQRQMAEVGVETLKGMFEEMLLLSRADQLDVRVPPSELQRALEQTKESFGIRTEQEYEEALRQSGMTRDLLREQIRNSIRIREVFALEVYPEVGVEEEDLRRYYGTHQEEFETTAAHKLREVVVLDSSGMAPAEMDELARKLREAIVAGEAEALLLESEGAGQTTGWIELGWVEAGDLDPELEVAVAELEEGAVSEPVAARGGLHLIQLVEARPARVREFAEVRDEIEAAERDRRFQKKLAEHMSQLEDAAFIVANPPVDAAGFRAGRERGATAGTEELVPGLGTTSPGTSGGG